MAKKSKSSGRGPGASEPGSTGTTGPATSAGSGADMGQRDTSHDDAAGGASASTVTGTVGSMPAALEPVPRAGARAAILAVLAVGLFVAVYLTYHHVRLTYGEYFDSLCNVSETINCDTVNTSDYSELFKLPIAIYAIPTYLVMAFLTAISLGRRPRDVEPLSYVVAISLLTVLASLGLAYVSIVQIKAVCLFCITLYVVHLLTFGLALFASKESLAGNIRRVGESLARPGLALTSFAVFLLTLGVAVGAEEAYKSRLVAEAKARGGETVSQVASGLVHPEDASYGPKDAKVTLVEFADFQCGYCKRMSYTVKSLKEQYGDRVRFVFKNFPMSPKCNAAVKNDRHPFACDAARAGVCANRQGKFWDFHDLTFKNQRNLKVEDLEVYARSVGLDMAQYRQCMADPTVNDVIKRDVEASRPFEITGTPRIIINGKQHKGMVPLEVLEANIVQELQAAGDKTAVASKPAVAPEAPAADPAQSPEMVEIKLGDKAFLIDAFEASRGPAGQAVSAFDKAPFFKSSWYDAKAACEAAGKRVCTQGEWIAACQNAAVVDDNQNGKLGDDLIEGTEFSYSDFYQKGNCNDGSGNAREDAESGKISFTGNFARCRTPTGVYDMNGNVQEWVGSSEDTALLMGGNYYAGEKASCFAIQDTFGAGFANRGTGFRCCKDK